MPTASRLRLLSTASVALALFALATGQPSLLAAEDARVPQPEPWWILTESGRLTPYSTESSSAPVVDRRSAANHLTLPTGTPPEAPTGFAVEDIPGTFALRFSWDDQQDADRFVIQRLTDGGFENIGGEFSASPLTLFAVFFSPGEAFEFRLVARNDSGDSAPTDIVAVEKFRAGISGTYQLQAVGNGKLLHHGEDATVSTRFQNVGTKFDLEEQPDGSVRLRPDGRSTYLHADDLGDRRVSTRFIADDDFTRFFLEEQQDGTYRIRVKASGRYWHNEGLGSQQLVTLSDDEADGEFSRFRLTKLSSVFCAEGALCLTNGRFSVLIRFETREGEAAFASIVDRRSDDSGLFSFFDPDNWELLIKVLDACAINDRFWVFWSGTTDVQFDLSVTDTLTGESRTWSNPQGNLVAPVADTDAFATCDERL